MAGETQINRSKDVWQPAFLLALRHWGNVSQAAEKAGVQRVTVYNYRRSDPEFRAKWDEALEYAVDRLEKIAWQRATRPQNPSDTLLIFLLKALRPEKFQQSRQNYIGQVTVLKIGGHPERRLAGSADLAALTDEELAALAAAAPEDVEVEIGDYRLLEPQEEDGQD